MATQTEVHCNQVACSSRQMAYFMGVLLFALGANMLFNYWGSYDYMMGVAGGMQMGALTDLAQWVSRAVAYSWPVAALLIGLSYLTRMYKCWAHKLFLVYLAFFALGHLWVGDTAGATWDLVVALFVFVMKGFSGMGMNGMKK